MSRLFVVLIVTIAVVGVALALAPFLPVGGRAPAPTGYRVRGDRVTFEFRPRRWPLTTLIASGDTVPTRELRIQRVSLVGPFNGWTPGAWPLRRGESKWRLRCSRAELGGDSVAFAFVVNDRFWVEPALTAPNRAAAPSAGGRNGLWLSAPAPR